VKTRQPPNPRNFGGRENGKISAYQTLGHHCFVSIPAVTSRHHRFPIAKVFLSLKFHFMLDNFKNTLYYKKCLIL
jgi:hypothetical protein